MRTRFLAPIALVLALSSPAQADDLQTLAQQYVDLPANQQMINDMFSPEMLASQFRSGLPAGLEISDEKLAKIGELMSRLLMEKKNDMQGFMVASMTQHFTEEEIAALIRFYQDEVGASAMSKMAPFMQDYMASMAPALAEIQQQMMPELMAILSE